MVSVIAHRVLKDEPCWGLAEAIENGRIIQKLWVIRGDRKARYTTDFGPASDYPDFTPIIYASVGDDTVAQLQECAERDRHDNKWAKRRRELQSESTLIADILRQEERKIQERQNRSVFGPLQSTQRTDYPREAIQSRAKEMRNDRANNH
ncbi:hypothetical protein LCGC14_2687000 [marine sediment metagenome]|uniref:Uncharacterized protein n=1 Tax=marine sediment metagenome TaxID=412755 RepID=A0A0F9CBD7_9ZZZZ